MIGLNMIITTRDTCPWASFCCTFRFNHTCYWRESNGAQPSWAPLADPKPCPRMVTVGMGQPWGGNGSKVWFLVLHLYLTLLSFTMLDLPVLSFTYIYLSWLNYLFLALIIFVKAEQGLLCGGSGTQEGSVRLVVKFHECVSAHADHWGVFDL